MSGRGAVCVTGVGTVTPAGDGRDATWKRVCQGLPTAALDDEGQPPRLACRVPPFGPGRLNGLLARKPDRCVQLALLAAREAVADAGLDPGGWDGARVAVVAGAGCCGAQTYEAQHRVLLDAGQHGMSAFSVPGALGNALAAQLAMDLHATGPGLTVNTACASGATAICTALDLLALDRCDIAVAGGAEAPLTPFFQAGFDRMHALSSRFGDPAGALRPFDADRDGFVMGEGAGMLVLERERDARARGARPRARVAGQGATSDAHHIVKPDPGGRGLAAALRQALAAAGAAPADVAHVNAHGTGTPLGDRVEAGVLAEVLPHRPPVTSTKAVTGHLLGAAGAVEAALTVLAVERRLIPPTANLAAPSPGIDLDLVTTPRPRRLPLALSVSTGFGGHNVALAFAEAS
ncbi:beta-ketoacyl-[acyl-carrier-protein] synthase family protein [Streptomyces sp. MP131-18]|uniref:beta-ketoacyl-[acyl-carrier-protein] synthase family protein n=1 Tax=Streptomyces sp. MP131-18 TaxID=1857892 RepID=UPI00097C61C0|nr:beta-ketoacyl-[acyl-carrier-protein] synthase family protein [Streptomyces sp. MP131-18]ONK11337.1 3-oxoacyl-[acyl-carrier-protein] synthase 2 [Streptomyces sp. MP131-18]